MDVFISMEEVLKPIEYVEAPDIGLVVEDFDESVSGTLLGLASDGQAVVVRASTETYEGECEPKQWLWYGPGDDGRPRVWMEDGRLVYSQVQEGE
jgi:hypothetical protein